MPTSTTEIQDTIWCYMHEIDNWNEDSTYQLVQVNKELRDYLVTAGTDNAVALASGFQLSPESSFDIVTSDDGKLRIYQWDTRLDEAQVIYHAVAQYSTGSEVKTAVLSNEWWCDRIHTVATQDGRAIYMVISSADTGLPYGPQQVQAYTVTDGVLTEGPEIFRNTTGSASRISIEYDGIAAYGQEMLHLSADRQKLYVPVCDDLIFTGSYFVYIFDGDNYVPEKKPDQ